MSREKRDTTMSAASFPRPIGARISKGNLRGRSPPSRIDPKARIAFVEANRKERREWRRYRY
jgi:hypothetical protein